MKKSLKYKFGTLILLLLLVSGFFIVSNANKINWGDKPRDPINQIPITHNLGWWSYQDSLVIDSFSVKIIESRLNLFNSKSLISYRIKGKMKYKNSWKPKIEKIHISEKFVRKYNRELHPYLDIDSNNTAEALIEVTPIVNVYKDNNYKEESIPFEFTNELTIESFHWGNNKIRIQCLDRFQDIELFQKK